MAASEEQLLARARNGDEAAFSELVGRHSDRVYRTLRRFGLTPEEASETAQEVFLRAWRGLGGFEGRSQLSTWLYRISFNEAHRALGRRQPAPAAPVAGGADPMDSVVDDRDHEPDAQALNQELADAVDHALAQLPADLRTAVILRDLEGLSSDEAAEAAGVRTAALKSRLHRGRVALRELLAPYLERAM